MRSFLTPLFVLISLLSHAQMPDAPDRNEGIGPFSQMIIRGATLINGNGAPPIGPVDIVIEGNRITKVVVVGYPGVPIDPDRRPKLKEGGHEIQAEGKYVLPGFIDMHGHTGGMEQGTTPEYVYKLWLAHGITTIREPGSFNGREWTLRHRERSQKNQITAPRIKAYVGFGMGWKEPISTEEQAWKWVQENARAGADGIKLFGAPPEIMQAALEENKALGLRSACHHAQMDVARWNALRSAKAGLTTMEHWYGLPEALFTDRTIQEYPVDYNYMNEQHRFGEAGKLWKQAAAPGSVRWNEVMNEMLALDFTLDPTFAIYEANRDLQRAMRAEWHETYTLPSLWTFFQPSRISHGSHWHDWGTEQEVDWKENYRLWMAFVNEYKNRGGRVTVGSDAGYIYQLYGFAYIRELEMLREAGFHPLEVIRSATLYGAEALGMDDQVGTVEVGKLADLIIVGENPIANLKVLYGTGTIKLNEDNEVTRVGGVEYTIKDGIVFDARELLNDVAEIVAKAKEKQE
ncbi:MAG: amidohydrolase family protein [Bacteroidota bacterium]|nr:amidohydrolase family protein [Bacteroidota bacterium]